MDSLSSDEEYFDTLTNFPEDNKKEKVSDNCEFKPLSDLNDLNNYTNISPAENSFISKNTNIFLDVSDNSTNCDNVLEFTKDSINSTETKDEILVKDSDVISEQEIKINSSDSSDSESLSEKLNYGSLEKEETSQENEMNQSAKENGSIKMNDDVQHEERLKLESFLSDCELEDLRDSALNMKIQGNSCFQVQSYEEATNLYTNAIATCPLKFKEDHAIFHMNRGSALAKLEKNDEAINDFSESLVLKPDYLKALLKRAELRQKTEKLTEALDDYRQVLKFDPHNWTALHAEQTLPEQIKIQQEKMKEEMMKQLKQLGNLVLKPFGLSTDNFKLVQDPKTGSYSVNFQNK